MNAYKTATDKGITGTPTQIVAILRALSQENIPAAKLRRWLSDNELLSYDGNGWFGKLEEVTLSAELTAGIRSLKERVLSGDPVRTADPAFAPKVLAIVQGVAAAVPEIAGLVDSFYALDGDRPYKDLTVEQYAAQVADSESLSVKQTALQLVETAVESAREEFRKAESTPESIIAAAVAVLGGG
jgi:hypothetical protein